MDLYSKHCEANEQDKDHIYLYACALLYECLKYQATRDFVRENDGQGMIRSWRLLVPQFWGKRGNKYLIIAHKFMSGTRGYKLRPQKKKKKILI